MGSNSTQRKKADSPIIRTPKVLTSSNKGGSGSGAGGGYKQDEVANVCIPSFEIKVETDIPLKKEQAVFIRKNKDDVYDVLAGTKLLATLSKKVSDMIAKCTDMGVVYIGTIIQKRNGDFYARFLRGQ